MGGLSPTPNPSLVGPRTYIYLIGYGPLSGGLSVAFKCYLICQIHLHCNSYSPTQQPTHAAVHVTPSEVNTLNVVYSWDTLFV